MTAPGVRVPRHRATTAHLASAYPFLAEPALNCGGPYLGTDLTGGGRPFSFCPFEAYQAGIVTNPNMIVVGEPGAGKSAAVKAFLYRSVGAFGRWTAIADPKGEYSPLADALGLDVIRLRPGGTARLNPLDAGPTSDAVSREEAARRQADLVATLVAGVLRRELTPVEDAALGWALEHLTTGGRPLVTLADVVAVLAEPPGEMASRACTTRENLAASVTAVTYGLGKLLDRSLRGMFDGASTVRVDWSGPGIVLDLSAVHHDPDALTLVMVAATAWLRTVMDRPDGPPRLQVLDEAWCLLAQERTMRYLQACWKLGRAQGLANIAVVHRLADLRAQADDGSATAKVGMGILGDTQTRVLFRQSTDQVADAAGLLRLSDAEAALLPRLSRGRALWKIGDRTAVVAHVLSGTERALADTDARMATR
jgi:hypothetical protein